MQNIASGGGTWTTYNVTAEQLETRVGAKIARGAQGLWYWVRRQADRYFG
jgi:putative hydrolases of HD superfamily